MISHKYNINVILVNYYSDYFLLTFIISIDGTNVLWRLLEKNGVPVEYTRVIRDMYERVRTIVRTAIGDTQDFSIDIELHQGSALNPFLFTIVMDELTREIQNEIP